MKYSLFSLTLLASLVPASAQVKQDSRLPSVNKVSVVSQEPFQLRIETSSQTTPQAQMIEGPDRLVIDLPNTQPGAGLRRVTVNHGAVRSVRTSLYSTQPPATRIVVDLTLPQWYRIVPDSSGVLVTIGGGTNAPSDPGTTIGWVSTKSPSHRVSAAKTTPAQTQSASTRRPSPVNGVSVEFANGLLSIHASNATLSEVLYQIQKKTGAEIAIPAGTEQERVAADLGPSTPSEVLSQLLNGSRLNFVVVGSESDPNSLRSVLLSPKGPDMPEAQRYSPPVAQNMQNEAPDPVVAVPGPEVQQRESNPEGVMPPPPQDAAPGT